jgi:hypothetical protein
MSISKRYVVINRFHFLAEGTILEAASTGGTYFIPAPVGNFENGVVIRPVLSSHVVEDDTEHFFEVTGVDPENVKVLGSGMVVVSDPVRPFNRPILTLDEIKAEKGRAYKSSSKDYHVIPDPHPSVHKIPTPHPSKWPGALVVSKYVVSNYYGSIPAGTIFQLQGHLTVNKSMRSISCSGCGVSLDYTFKGSREAFLHNFYFVARDTSDEPLTQAILLGG